MRFMGRETLAGGRGRNPSLAKATETERKVPEDPEKL